METTLTMSVATRLAFACCLVAAIAARAAEQPKLPADAAEPQVVEFLSKAREAGDAYSAHVAMKGWISRNSSPSAVVIGAAADTALAAGDLQSAASLYKKYIAAAPADEARSQAAARLYEILVTRVQSHDDIYAFFTRSGLGLRQSLAARQFDSWFLEQARARGDLVTAAQILAAVLADKLPLELERNLYWDNVDWLMSQLAQAKPGMHPAAPAARQIVGLLRESPQRAARYGFITSWLEFQAAIVGKDQAAQAAAFAPVAAAGLAYVDAVPAASTLNDMLNVFFCGTNNHQPWQTLGGPITGLWTAAFSKLPDDQKAGAINWNGWWQFQASPDQWVELGAKFPAVFQKAAGSLPLLINRPDPAVFAAQSTFLTGVPSDAARVVNAVAATKGTDLLAGLKHLSQAENWYGDFGSTWGAAQQVWAIYRTFPRQPATTDAEWYKALAAWGPEGIARTPIALFQPDAAGAWLATAFGMVPPEDKTAFAAELHRLDWVPWDDKGRKAAIGPAHGAFGQWANQVRQQLTAAQAAAKAAPQDKAKADDVAKWEKAAGQIGPLEEEFKKAFDVNVSAGADWAKLADPLAIHLGRCVQSVREKKLDAYVANAREAYKLLRAWPGQKTPFGSAALRWILSNSVNGIDTSDFAAEVVADQIAAWQPGAPTAALTAIDAALAGGRPNVNFWDVPKDNAPQALKLNAVIGKAILAHLQANRFEPDLFTRFRYSKMGSGWKDQGAGADVMATLIDTKAFIVHKQNPFGASATTSYQQLIRQEFNGLAGKYPPETFFDDMFVEESKARGWLDWTFFNYSQDQKQKAATAAAEMFAGYAGLAAGPNAPKDYDRLPLMLVAGSQANVQSRPTSWSPGDVNNWYSRAASYAAPAARAKFIEAAEAAWGKTRFDGGAMGYWSIPGDPAAIAAAPARAECFKKIAAVLERRKAYPVRTGGPGLNAVHQIPAASLAPEELSVLLAAFESPTPTLWYGGGAFEVVGSTLAQSLLTAGRVQDLARIAPELWRIPREVNNMNAAAPFASIAAAAAKAGKPSIAATMTECGLQMLGGGLPESIRTQLSAVRTEALLALGGGNPVPRNDPRWPIFESQIQFAAGKTLSAWQLYVPNAAIVTQAFKELDLAYLLWVIRENTQTGGYDRARNLGQTLLAWSESNPGALAAEPQAELLVAYADIALARREYAQARALYERISAAKEFDGTQGQRDAELRVAEVDRLTRQFDKSFELLQKLSRRPDRAVQTEAFYQLALLKTDQEEIQEAAGFLEEVFTRLPNHVGGRILEGKLNLLRRKYDVAAKVRLGVLGDKKFLIPGKPLEIDLEDRNLAVVGKATQIEIRAWTASGDEEQFSLFPFGDSKTRFTGQIPTALGVPVKGDHILQVLGGDTVRYAFAESFNAGKAAVEEPPAMTVVTDSDLFASSGTILSKEELETLELERQIRARISLESQKSPDAVALSSVRSFDQIKPGNPVNVRVVDPDRSSTADRDSIEVRVSSASGDSLRAKLTETSAASGIFEGAVPTASGQATAYASDSTEGNDPNYAIGPATGTPWVALADSKRPKTFAIDLNDNVALGKMTVTANVPGRKLKDVYVQTSINGRDFRTVGQWRSDGKATFVPWDGGPRLELARISQLPKAFSKPAEFAAYLEEDRLPSGAPLVLPKIDSLVAGPWDGNLGGNVAAMAMNTNWYVGHWVAGFEVPKPQTRTFTLDPKGKTGNIAYVFAIDGQISQDPTKPFQVSKLLSKGVHRIDVYAYAERNAGLNFEVLIDSPEPPFTASIPKDSFSIEKHPAIADAFGVPPAEIKGNADGSAFDVAFASGARARVVRFIIADFETDAPAINSVTLFDADGKKILPTEKSFLDLAKNDVLEIIPGDKLTILYEDPTVITPAKTSQERFLTATFSNANVSAAFVEFRENGADRTVRYVPMRRFGVGDTVKVFIGDPDMDTSAEPDRVTFSAKAGRGKAVQVEAIETDAHSGVFIGTFFTVAGEPERPSEIKVAAGEDLTVAYIDRENTDPGIPWERISIVEQVGSDEPQMRVYDVASRPLDEAERTAANEKVEAGRRFEEKVAVTRDIVAVRPEQLPEPGAPARILVDGPLLVEVLAPAIAKSAESQTEIFVQTRSGREKLGREIAEGEFPLDAPGTIKLHRTPGDAGTGPLPPGTRQVVVVGNRFAGDALTDGRFTFLVDKELGPLPKTSLAESDFQTSTKQPALQIKGDDTIYVGHRYKQGDEERWLIQAVELASDASFEVMDERYREAVTGTYVGDSLHLRLIQPGIDVSDEKDRATVRLTSAGGSTLDLALTETFGHSGVFKGTVQLVYRDPGAAQNGGNQKEGNKNGGKAADGAGEPATPTTDGRSLAVAYGETVTLRYEPASGDPIERSVLIFKGGDGRVVPFTKRFNDPTIAVQTQFTVAEAWFELAKRHRELGQESLARREIAQGKKLLEEAIRDYPDTDARAQADYLLANLSFEFSKEATNEDIKRQHALDAVTRFSDIVSSHPESPYAPKSQYKKALVLEALGEIDAACEEYVKLSYRYPDNELVAETIARLGQYFLSKGKQLDEEAAAQADPVEKEKGAVRGREMFTTAAEVFARLSERFPRHSLANKTKMLSAQCYLRAKDFKRALAGFEAIAKDSQTEKDLAAEAMYWAGDVCMQQNDLKNAYRNFKKLTWDFPESKWAKFARGRLTEDALARVEVEMETNGQ